MMPIRRAATIAALVNVLCTRVALAGPAPCAPAGPWVLATVKTLPRGLPLPDIIDRLGVELSARGLSLCTAPPPSPTEPAIASVVIDQGPSSPTGEGQHPQANARAVSIDVEVRRGDATKHARRDVDLAGAPRDRGATVVALAADELMRAASEELALQATTIDETARPWDQAAGGSKASGTDGDSPRLGAAATGRPPTANADARVRRPMDGPTVEQSVVALGARGGGEAWTGGFTLFGGDGLLSLHLWPRTRIEVLAGARVALELEFPQGVMDAHAFSARVGGAMTLTRPGASVEIAAGARLAAYAVSIATRSTAAGSQTETDTSGALVLEAGPSMRVPLGDGSKALLLDVALAAAPLGADAALGDVGLSGVGVGASLGLATGAL